MLDVSCGLVEENRALRAELAALRQEVEVVRGQLERALQQIVELEQCQCRKPLNIKPNRGESGEPQAPLHGEHGQIRLGGAHITN